MFSLKNLIYFTFISYALAIDLCLIFKNCHLQNVKHGNQARTEPGLPALRVDDEWIEPDGGDLNQIYHFGKNAGGMDWFDADRYCESKGGFLAEPASALEQNFLAGQAEKIPAANWWIGLRETENCNCEASGRTSAFDRGSTTFEASLDFNSLRDENGGYVKTTCPSGYIPKCRGNVWKWAFSGQKMSYSDWNVATSEPNGDTEHCTTLWAKNNYRWGDWPCKSTSDSTHPFKPVCQKSKSFHEDHDDYNYDDDHAKTPEVSTTTTKKPIIVIEDNPNAKHNDDDSYEYDYDYDYDYSEDLNLEEMHCLEVDTLYKYNKEDILESFVGVGNVDECKRVCAENSQCQFWTWKGGKRSKKCTLSKSLKKERNFKRTRVGFSSGSMLGSCLSEVDINWTPTPVTKGYCVEYGMMYEGGAEGLRRVKDVQSVESCKNICGSTKRCQFYTWKSRQNKCILMSGGNFQTFRNPSTISGSVVGSCQGELSTMQSCSCINDVPLKKNRDKDEEFEEVIDTDDDDDDYDYDDYEDEYKDFVGEGLINPRIQGVGSQTGKTKCNKQQVRRCSIGGDSAATPIEAKDVCGDYDIQYNRGGQIKRFNNVPNADVCRARCINNGECKHWTWKGSSRRKQCILVKNGNYKTVYQKGSVSGTLNGACANLALSQLEKCECLTLRRKKKKGQNQDEFNDDQEDLDLVGTGLIDVRVFDGSSPTSVCSEGQGLRCYAENASPIIVGRLGPQEPKKDAVVFGN